MKNWKTTAFAILAFIGVIVDVSQCALNGGNIIGCITEYWPALAAAFGLLFAKDFSVSHTQK